MKPREQRRKVYVPARLRMEQQWMDVRVLDVSSRGFKLQAASTPKRGAYIELCRGSQSFIARVVWTSEQRFGVRTQDPVNADMFISPPAVASKPVAAASPVVLERRSARRALDDEAHRLERSRQLARTMEFGWLAACGAFGTAVILGLVQQALAHPFVQIAASLK